MALVVATLLMAGCDGNKEKNNETENVEVTENQEVASEVVEAPVLTAETLIGTWVAVVPTADSEAATYTLTIKEGNKYDLVEAQAETAADKLINDLDKDFTIEGNFVTLSASSHKLEYADDMLYILNQDGARATIEGNEEANIFKRLVVEVEPAEAEAVAE